MATATAQGVRKPNLLLLHMYDTYRWLRLAMGVLALAFPLVVVVGHRLGGTDQADHLRQSLSAYYSSPHVGYFFVGTLFQPQVGNAAAGRLHPLLRAFAGAVLAGAAARI